MGSSYSVKFSGAAALTFTQADAASKIQKIEIDSNSTSYIDTALIDFFDRDSQASNISLGDRIEIDINGYREFDGYVHSWNIEWAGQPLYHYKCIGRNYDLYRYFTSSNAWYSGATSIIATKLINDYVTTPSPHSYTLNFRPSMGAVADVGKNSTIVPYFECKGRSVGKCLEDLCELDGYRFQASASSVHYYQPSGILWYFTDSNIKKKNLRGFGENSENLKRRIRVIGGNGYTGISTIQDDGTDTIDLREAGQIFYRGDEKYLFGVKVKLPDTNGHCYDCTLRIAPSIFYGSSGVRSVDIDSGVNGVACPFHCHGDKTRYEHINDQHINTYASCQLKTGKSSGLAVWFKSGLRQVKSIYGQWTQYTTAGGYQAGSGFTLDYYWRVPYEGSWRKFYSEDVTTGGVIEIENLNFITSGIRVVVTNNDASTMWHSTDELGVWIIGFSCNRASAPLMAEVVAEKRLYLSSNTVTEWSRWMRPSDKIVDLRKYDYWTFVLQNNESASFNILYDESNDYYSDGCFVRQYYSPIPSLWTSKKLYDLVFEIGWGGTVVYEDESVKLNENTNHNDAFVYEYRNSNITDYSAARDIAKRLLSEYDTPKLEGTIEVDGLNGLYATGKISGCIDALGITTAETFKIAKYKHILLGGKRFVTKITLNNYYDTLEKDVNKMIYNLKNIKVK